MFNIMPHNVYSKPEVILSPVSCGNIGIQGNRAPNVLHLIPLPRIKIIIVMMKSINIGEEEGVSRIMSNNLVNYNGIMICLMVMVDVQWAMRRLVVLGIVHLMLI